MGSKGKNTNIQHRSGLSSTMSDSIEIVGLHRDSDGRSFTVHALCGDHTAVGDVLRLVPCVIQFNGKVERATKCVKVIDGVDACAVAHAPCQLMDLPKVQAHVNEFVQVRKLCGNSKNVHKHWLITEWLPGSCWMSTMVALNRIEL